MKKISLLKIEALRVNNQTQNWDEKKTKNKREDIKKFLLLESLILGKTAVYTVTLPYNGHQSDRPVSVCFTNVSMFWR